MATDEKITAAHLLAAYRHGIFPMARDRDDTGLRWYDPPRRGILPLDRIVIPTRLRRTLRQQAFTITVDRAFTHVMQECAAARLTKNGDRLTTWISGTIIDLYTELHDAGCAHSVEVWRDDELVGGLYGVTIGAAFCGESMFSILRDASKVALVYLLARLVARGFRLCDTQFLTPHLAQFGGIEISRARYRALLSTALEKEVQFAGLDEPVEAGAAFVAALLAASGTG